MRTRGLQRFATVARATRSRICGPTAIRASRWSWCDRDRCRPAGLESRGGAEPDGIHARVPHHPRVAGRRVPGDHADRELPRSAPWRRRRAATRPALVEGRRRDVRGRRRDGHGAVVRVRPAVAGVHRAVRRGLRRPVRDRGDLLLPRGDLRRDLHLRMAAAGAVDALLGRRADRDHGARRRLLGRRRQLVDEPAAGLLADERRRDQGAAAEGDLQPGGPVRGPAHDPCGVPRDGVPRRVGLRRRHAAWPAGSLPPPRAAHPAHDRRDRDADPVRGGRHGRAGDREGPAGQVRRHGVRAADRDPRDRVHLRPLHLQRRQGRDRHPGVRLLPRRLQHRHAGDRAGLRAARRPAARQHDAALGVRHDGRHLHGADRPRALARLRLVAKAGHPADALVPAGDRGLGGRGGRRARGRLDRHRGRPAAVDRQRRHADRGRGHEGGWHLGDVRAGGRAVRGPGRDARGDPARHVAALAGRRRVGDRGAVRAARRRAGRRVGRGRAVSTADAVAGVLWTGVTAYAVFGGADFGAGFWSLAAGGGVHGRRARDLVDWAIGPVWEANHVWLIFVLVVLWTAFPTAFEAIFSTLFIPLSLAALGIVLRGAGFAFHKTARRLEGRGVAERLFGVSSLLTPFFLGTVVGAVASGRVPVGNATGDPVTSWLNPLSLLIGALFVATSAYLAAVFLISDARRADALDLELYFTVRAFATAVATGALAIAGIVTLHSDARYVYDGLTGDGLPLVIVSLLCGIGVLVMLRRGAHRGARLLAVGAVIAVVWGWGAAQHPYLLPQVLTIDAGAAPSATLTTVLVVFGVAAVLVVPSIALLFMLVQRSTVTEGSAPEQRSGT